MRQELADFDRRLIDTSLLLDEKPQEEIVTMTSIRLASGLGTHSTIYRNIRLLFKMYDEHPEMLERLIKIA